MSSQLDYFGIGHSLAADYFKVVYIHLRFFAWYLIFPFPFNIFQYAIVLEDLVLIISKILHRPWTIEYQRYVIGKKNLSYS